MAWGTYKFHSNMGFIVEIILNIFSDLFSIRKLRILVELHNFSLYVFIRSKNIQVVSFFKNKGKYI